MTTHRMVEEAIETGDDGRPILGYRVPKAALQDFCDKARAYCGGKCLFATKEDGEHVNVVIFPYSEMPTGEFLEAMARLGDQNEIPVSRLNAAEIDAKSVEFGAEKRPKRR